MKPDDGYIAYIINPKSGASSSKLTGRQFHRYLVEKGFEVRVSRTSSLEHACELATDAAVDYDCAMAVAVGGDGTIREVAHGLEGSDKPLLMVPCGTENLLANELGFDEKLKTIVRAFEGGYIRSLDLGSANGKNQSHRVQLCSFHNRYRCQFERPDRVCGSDCTSRSSPLIRPRPPPIATSQRNNGRCILSLRRHTRQDSFWPGTVAGRRDYSHHRRPLFPDSAGKIRSED